MPEGDVPEVGAESALALSAAALPAIGSMPSAVPVPDYDRSALEVGIVHIGVGGFHRSHQAMFVDRLLRQGASQWGICGVGILPVDQRMRDVLTEQDGLYTLVLKHPDGTLEPRVLGPIVEYLLALDDPEAVIERMASPTVRIVSLTVTEGGYYVDPITGRFDPAAAGIAPGLPATQPLGMYGLVVEALVRRRDRGIAPFTVMSCDNLPGNGDLARGAFIAAASFRDTELAIWMHEKVCFPNSMVDRITPQTTDEDRDVLARRFGVRDSWPVVAEPFVQWVLEDEFANGRPAFDEVGVQLVEDVTPYESMKLRMLNAGHQLLGYLGYLAGYRYTDEVMRDPAYRSLLSDYLWDEAAPTVPPVPGIDLDEYANTLLERFGNPAVRDTLLRLCTEGSDRIKTFVLPVIRDRLRAGQGAGRAVLIVAAWARFVEGVDEQGEPIPVLDRSLDTLAPAILRQRETPTALLTDTDVLGDLADDPDFVAAFTTSLAQLRADGARKTVSQWGRRSEL